MKSAEAIGPLDSVPLSRLQILVILCCALVAMTDGFDTQAIGYVAPAIVQSWSISKVALGPVFSAGLIGALFGALLFSPIADRFGRKPVLIVCATVFGCASIATAFADSVPSLLALRLVTGLGMGGAMPVAIAQTSEFAPSRVRALAVTLTYCGFSIGAALGGLVADHVMERYGWQAVFIVGGIPPLGLALVMAFALPESIAFLLGHPKTHARGEALLERLGVKLATLRELPRAATRLSPIVAVGRLFADGRAAMTVAIWTIVFMNLVELYFFSSWLPTVIHEAGIGIGAAASVTALFQVGGTVGALVIGRTIDRFRPFRVLACVYSGAAVFVSLVGWLVAERAGGGLPEIAAAVTLAGVCVVGGQIGVIATASSLYPTTFRSSGVGWALGIGRIGSVLGPLLGSVLMAAQLPVVQLFLIGSVPAIIATVTALRLDALTTKRSAEAGALSVSLPPL